MGLNNLGMGVVFTASDLASNVIRQISSSFLNLDSTVGAVSGKIASAVGSSADVVTSSLKRIGVGLSVAAAGFLGLKTAFGLAAPAGDFEQKIASVGAVTRATAKELDILEKSAIRAGIATQFSPTEAVDGLLSLATAGLRVKDATEALIPVLDLAAGSLGQLGVAQAAEAVVGTLNSYKLAADQAAITTDKLLRITQLTNFQTRDFASGLSTAAAAGALFGQGLDDVLISMGQMRNKNIDASRSATAFREAVTRLASDQRAQKAVTDQQVKVFDDVTGKMRSVVDIIGDFDKATKSLTEQDRNAAVVRAFGKRGLIAFGAIADATFKTMKDGKEITLEGTAAIAALRKEMGTAEGTAATFRDALLNTFKGQGQLLTGTLSVLAVTIGKPFAKVLKPIVDVVVRSLNLLNQIVLAIPDSVKKFAAGIFVIGSATAIFIGLGAAISGLIPILIAAATTFGPAILAAGAPFAVFSALVISAGAAIALAWNTNFGGIRDMTIRVVDKISLAWKSLIALFTKGEISGALAKELLKAENAGLFRFVRNAFRIGIKIKEFFIGVGEGIKESFSDASFEASGPLQDIAKTAGEIGAIILDTFNDIALAVGLRKPGDAGVKSIRALAKEMTIIAGGALVEMTAAVGTLVKGLTKMASVLIKISNALGGVAGVAGLLLTFVPGLSTVGSGLVAASLAGKLTGGNKSSPGSSETLEQAAKRFAPGGSSFKDNVDDKESAVANGTERGFFFALPGVGKRRSSGIPAAPTTPAVPTTPAQTQDDQATIDSFFANQPTTFQGTVILNGREVGEAAAEAQEEARARSGRPRFTAR